MTLYIYVTYVYIYIYMYMHYTTRIPILLVYGVYIKSCRISTINIRERASVTYSRSLRAAPL